MNLFEYTYDLVRQIPDHHISTYGAVARALGDIRAARAVGWMMNQNPDPDGMPCYKIVYSDGALGGFGRGIEDKIRRLRDDNITVKDGKIVDFKTVVFEDFKTEYPLKKLRQEQIDLSKKVRTRDEFTKIETVAGIDVAYPKNEFEEACAACVTLDYKTKQLVEEKTVFATAEFPYIPTYLSYREFPIIKHLVDQLERPPSLVLFDGNGILHPYGIGLASHAGVVLDRPAIGVAKNLLVGTVGASIVTIDGTKRGYAYVSKGAKKPIYISPGHKVSFETSLDVVKKLCIHKIPEPLRKAHTLAKEHLLKTR